MRHAATASILERRDTIIVASVSCIYGIGDPEEYKGSMLTLRKNQKISRDVVRQTDSKTFVETISGQGTFRVKAQCRYSLTYERNDIRITFFDDEIRLLFSITRQKSEQP